MDAGLYEADVSRRLAAVRELVERLEDPGEGHQRHPEYHEVDAEFSKLAQAIKLLDTEARTQADASSRKALQAKIKQFKDDMKGLRATFRTAKERSEKRKLIGGARANGSPGGGSAAADARRMALEERAARGTQVLEESKRNMMDIEETAITVSEQLSQNRATIMSTKRKIDATNSMASNARSILGRMEKNERLKKLCGYLAIAIVAIVLLYLFYRLVF